MQGTAFLYQTTCRHDNAYKFNADLFSLCVCAPALLHVKSCSTMPFDRLGWFRLYHSTFSSFILAWFAVGKSKVAEMLLY